MDRESIRVLGLWRAAWCSYGYQPWARLLHRFSLHHTRTFGPMDDGALLIRCEWCGVQRVERPLASRLHVEKEQGDD